MFAQRGMASCPNLTTKEDKAAHTRVDAVASGTGGDLHEGLEDEIWSHEQETDGKEGRHAIFI